MRTRQWSLCLLAVPLLLGGCAAAEGATAPAGTSAAAAEAAPPAAAEMVCGADIRGEVAQVLSLSAPAPTRTAWAHSVYTCTHELPMGPLVLSVAVADTPAAAAQRFDAGQAETGGTTAAGLGERSYTTPAGTVVVIKDDMVLTVDATALPAVFGNDGQRRNDFAYEIASVVLGCWTGHS